LRSLSPAGAEFAESSALLTQVVDEIVARGPVFVPMYRGVAARAAGDQETGARLLTEALAQAQGTDLFVTIIVLGQLHRFDEAFTRLQQLMAAGLPLQYAARLLVRLKRYPEAVAAVGAIERAGGFSELDQPWEAPALAAEALLGVGDAAAAAERSSVAIEAFERHLAGLALDVFRTMATDDLTIAGMYTTAVRAHARLAAAAGDHLARGFELSDRCRASSLRELIQLDRAARADPAADAALRAWQQAGAQLARTVEEVGDPDRAPRLPAEIQRAVRAAERTLDDATAAAHGPLDRWRRTAVTPPLAEVQRRLAPGTLLLQYHVFDDELVGWAVTRDSARVLVRSCPTVALTAQVRRFHRALARPQSAEPGQAVLGRELADLLLVPFDADLQAADRVLVVPHGPLAVLPFHVLPWAGDVLGAARTVSYLPAASVLSRDPAPPRVGVDAPTLVVGDPAYAPHRGLSRLAGAAVEAQAVGSLRGTRPLIAEEAGWDAVRPGLEVARVAHLATHGLLREGAPYSAELALAGDASVTVPDLAGLDTTIDLAVLSACDSGRGRATAAGDLVGLSRSLLGAGVRELIVSLWPVDDMLACLTMVALHEQLLTEPGSVGRALAVAQARIRVTSRAKALEWYSGLGGGVNADRVRTTRDLGDVNWTLDPSLPFYWAPFIHIGSS
jgi:CHAT domain-containing protein